MTVAADEFIRRFLLHTVPDGFHRIRHYGFLANSHRAAKLALCRKLLDAATTAGIPVDDAEDKAALRGPGRCPCCGSMMMLTGVLPPPCLSDRGSGTTARDLPCSDSITVLATDAGHAR
jgi:Putative transposase